jgi:hypothetical protein
MPTVDELRPATKAVLFFFEYGHLRDSKIQEVSKQCRDLAYSMALDPAVGGAQLTVGLQKLLEAKDCFVRAALTSSRE